MTDPLLWLNGDPTEGRRMRVPEPAPAAEPPPPGEPAPASPPSSRRRFGAALAGGAVSATLVAAGALALGLVDTCDPPASAAQRAPAPASSALSPRQQGDIAAIYRAASPAVVSVRAGSGSGTGFVVDTDGTVVTNAHVVGDSSQVELQFSDDRTATAEVAGVDTSSDLAVLQVDPAQTGTLTALELADSSTVRTGQLAVAIGSPFGLPQTATAGIVSGTGRHIQAPDGFQIDSVIQTDAPINPGNSGGPLLDADGRVIGVNSQIATGGTSQGNVGIGFAVPANTVRDVIPRLERGETIRRAYLGVSTGEGSGGAVVQEVTPGAPAASAGLQAGDVIVAIGGEQVDGPDDVAAAIQDRSPGDSIPVEVQRDGQSQTLDVVLAERPEQAP
jgi:putative serine protease PepD